MHGGAAELEWAQRLTYVTGQIPLYSRLQDNNSLMYREGGVATARENFLTSKKTFFCS